MVREHLEFGTDPDEAFIPAEYPFAGASALHLAVMKKNAEITALVRCSQISSRFHKQLHHLRPFAVYLGRFGEYADDVLTELTDVTEEVERLNDRLIDDPSVASEVLDKYSEMYEVALQASLRWNDVDIPSQCRDLHLLIDDTLMKTVAGTSRIIETGLVSDEAEIIRLWNEASEILEEADRAKLNFGSALEDCSS